MNLQDLAAELERCQVKLEVAGGKLKYSAPEPIPAALVEGLREHKVFLLHASWAANILNRYGAVRVETPETPDGSRIVNAPVDELHELVFYRLRAERWGTWGKVRARPGGKGKYRTVATWGEVPVHELEPEVVRR